MVIRDWTRVTIAMDIELNKRQKQYEMMKNNNISFSKLVNYTRRKTIARQSINDII